LPAVYKGKFTEIFVKPNNFEILEMRTSFASSAPGGLIMMMHLLTGVALWMVASVVLGLLVGRATHSYRFRRQTVRVPLAEAADRSPFERAA
jgi:hypothetical protein